MFISFLGIGQGGSALADEASKRGFYAGSINFSQKDLDSLENIQLKLRLVGSEGVGKQRQEAIKLMSNNWDLATNFVKENFSHSSIEIIIVPFSTDGGTGSGLSPILLNLLQSSLPEKTFVAMPIIPRKDEVIANQKNCLDAFDDLSKLDICVLPIDNEKLRFNSTNLSRSKLYSTINNQVISRIEKLLLYTEKSSRSSVLDKKDLLQVFNTKGIATIAECNLTEVEDEECNLSEVGVIKRIQESWEKNALSTIQYDQIISAGIVYDGQESLMENVNLKRVFSEFGNQMPINLYEGYYSEQNGTIISILSGLTWCTERLEQIDSIIEENQDKIQSIYNNTNKGYQSRTTNLFNSQVKSQPKKQPTVNDISDLINQFKR